MCGRFEKSNGGTRDAAHHWEEHFNRILRDLGFRRGKVPGGSIGKKKNLG